MTTVNECAGTYPHTLDNMYFVSAHLRTTGAAMSGGEAEGAGGSDGEDGGGGEDDETDDAIDAHMRSMMDGDGDVATIRFSNVRLSEGEKEEEDSRVAGTEMDEAATARGRAGGEEAEMAAVGMALIIAMMMHATMLPLISIR